MTDLLRFDLLTDTPAEEDRGKHPRLWRPGYWL